MKIFKLPDLGEGLPDAEVREWYVKVGDEVKTDQPLVAMETAKALVDVPAPFDGKIEKLFGEPGDTIETGQPLIGFEGEAEEVKKDTGTVVGAIEEGEAVLEESAIGVAQSKTSDKRIKVTPAVRMLAKQLGVNLEEITPAGDKITAEDVKRAAANVKPAASSQGPKIDGELTKLSNVRRAMVLSMTQSHQQIVPVTMVDDADINHWPQDEDISVRIIRAIQAACEAVPIVNAFFDATQMGYKQNDTINLGVAVDTPSGLYVPVLKDIANRDDASLREQINRFKQQAQDRSFPQEELQGATIMMSNYGTFAGRYASPLPVPPMVAIIGIGRARDEVVAENGKPVVHRVMPLAVTVDHRLITGGETGRCLKALIEALEK